MILVAERVPFAVLDDAQALRRSVEQEDIDVVSVPVILGELKLAGAILLARYVATGVRLDSEPKPEPARNGDDYLTVEEVAARLKVTKRWVYDHVKDLQGFGQGKFLRFPARAVEQYAVMSRKR